MISQKRPIYFAVLVTALFVMLFNSFIYGQLKNFGTKAKYKPEPNYHYSVYGYYDLIRESGVGFQYQLGSQLNIDVSAYFINKQYNLNNTIKQEDYYEFKGYGISIKPKFLISRLGRFYVGSNIAYESLQHDMAWVEYHFNHNLEDAKGEAYTIGLTLGNKVIYKHLFFEPYFGIGITSARLSQTLYDENPLPYFAVKYPTARVTKNSYFQMNIGLKIGFSFSKSKKHAAIDKKFDEVYIPKSIALGAYFETLDLSNQLPPKRLKRARARYRGLNRNALSAYKYNCFDSTKFYNKMDFLFNRIDSLIQGQAK